MSCCAAPCCICFHLNERGRRDLGAFLPLCSSSKLESRCSMFIGNIHLPYLACAGMLLALAFSALANTPVTFCLQKACLLGQRFLHFWVATARRCSQERPEKK